MSNALTYSLLSERLKILCVIATAVSSSSFNGMGDGPALLDLYFRARRLIGSNPAVWAVYPSTAVNWELGPPDHLDAISVPKMHR